MDAALGQHAQLRPCPRCGPLSRLRAREGALHEAICARCLGRYLPSDARETMLSELQIDDTILREMLASFAGEKLTCPGCGFATSEIRLRGRHAAMCTGCGGMWLDQGDLSKVTEERLREVGVTERTEDELPAKPPRFSDHDNRRVARGYRAVQLALVAGWLGGLAALKLWADHVGLDPGLRAMYSVMGTCGYFLWFLPTLAARRKKRFLRIFAANVLGLLLPPVWFLVGTSAIVTPNLQEPDRLTPRGERSTRRLGAAPEKTTAKGRRGPAAR